MIYQTGLDQPVAQTVPDEVAVPNQLHIEDKNELLTELFFEMISERKARESFVVRVTCDRQAFY